MSKWKKSIIVAGFAVISAAGAPVARAGTQVWKSASGGVCKLTTIQFDNNRLVLFCNGDPNLYYATVSPISTGCLTQSLDTIKVWAAMAQSALLAGRSLDFVYDSADGKAPNTACASGANKAIAWGMKLK